MSIFSTQHWSGVEWNGTMWKEDEMVAEKQQLWNGINYELNPALTWNGTELSGVKVTKDLASPFFTSSKKLKQKTKEFIWVIDKIKFYVKFIREVNRGWMLAQCHYFTHYRG